MDLTTFVTSNELKNSSDSMPPRTTPNFDWVIACFTVLSIVCFLTNLIVVVVVGASKELRKQPPYILITSLSVSTFYVSCIVLPFAVYTMIIKHWPNHLSLNFCLFNGFLTQFYPGVTAFHIMMVAVNRYFGTVWFEHYEKLSGKLALGLQIAISYILSALLVIVPIVNGHGQFDPITLRCSARKEVEAVSRYSDIVRFITFFVPMVVMVYCFLHIYISIRRKKHEVLVSDETDKKKQEEFSRFFNEVKTTKIAVCLFVTMFLRIPTMFIALAPPSMMFNVRNALLIIALSSQFCYPFVFIAMSKEFRHAFSRIFCCGGWKANLQQDETEMTQI